MPHPKDEQKFIDKIPSSKFILLGEDDVDDEELLKELFSSIDDSFFLNFINNGKRLINYLDALPQDHLPCLIVLDYNMPELSGADILQILKTNERYASIPKIIWSTSGTEMYKKRCFELGAKDYLIKPSKISELVQAIHYMISFC